MASKSESVTNAPARGRSARTRGISVTPTESELLSRYEQLTGRGLTDLVREQVLRRLPATVWALEEMADAGMTLVPEVLDVHALGPASTATLDREDTWTDGQS